MAMAFALMASERSREGNKMLGQLNIYGKDKVQVAIERLRTFEPPEGYYLAFSGGKDSVCIKALADMAGVKYDAHYNFTTVDPPELVQFVKTFPDVSMDSSYYSDGTRATMWNLIPKKKMPPTRVVRYCCEVLKEHGGEGRFCVTGVRKAESGKRARRGGVELLGKTRKDSKRYDPDNPDQEVMHICQMKAKRILNPIIDWEDDDVWEFIKTNKLRYCKLYDEGYTRLGCIGCPMSTHKVEELERYPKYRRAYIRAFQKMLEERKAAGLECKNEEYKEWKTGEDVFEWWIRR